MAIASQDEQPRIAGARHTGREHWVRGSGAPIPRLGRMSAIETVKLVREFRKGPRAVDGIDLRVEPGEIYGFLGPNGAASRRPC